jgi:hypothetical protein
MGFWNIAGARRAVYQGLGRPRKDGMADPDELTLAIARHLEIDVQYVEIVEAWDTERIAAVRSAGRKAGRLLGWKIVTMQTAPNDEDRVVVVVCVREWPSQEVEDRLTERARILMSEAWSKILPPLKPE